MEIWKSIPDYDGYEASSLGRIRSIDRRVWIKQRHRAYWKNLKGKILSVQIDKDGYNLVSMTKDKYTRPFRVSRLICSAFHGIVIIIGN